MSEEKVSDNPSDEEDSNDGMKPFCCNICAQGFHCEYAFLDNQIQTFSLAKDELKSHSCTRMHPKPFECDICQKGFSTKSNMQRHRNIHTKEKVFQCNHCSKVILPKRITFMKIYIY